MTKRKPQSRKLLVKKLDDAFQTFIRWRDGWTCIICGKVSHDHNKSDMHAGHYIDRGCQATRWSEINVNAQCKGCNYREHIDKFKEPYREKIIEKYGEEKLHFLHALKNSKSSFSKNELITLTEYYTQKIKEYREGI